MFGAGLDDTARAVEELRRHGYRHVLALSGDATAATTVRRSRRARQAQTGRTPIGNRLRDRQSDTALLERGFSIVCVEMGAQLAAHARRKLAGLSVDIHVAPFESWAAEPETFDLVYAATAWHWIDPTIRYEKAHRLLRPDGHLAFWSALHAFP